MATPASMPETTGISGRALAATARLHVQYAAASVSLMGTAAWISTTGLQATMAAATSADVSSNHARPRTYVPSTSATAAIGETRYTAHSPAAANSAMCNDVPGGYRAMAMGTESFRWMYPSGTDAAAGKKCPSIQSRCTSVPCRQSFACDTYPNMSAAAATGAACVQANPAQAAIDSGSTTLPNSWSKTVRSRGAFARKEPAMTAIAIGLSTDDDETRRPNGSNRKPPVIHVASATTPATAKMAQRAHAPHRRGWRACSPISDAPA